MSTPPLLLQLNHPSLCPPSHLSPSEGSAGRKFKVGLGIMGSVHQHMPRCRTLSRSWLRHDQVSQHIQCSVLLKSLDAPQQQHTSGKENQLCVQDCLYGGLVGSISVRSLCFEMPWDGFLQACFLNIRCSLYSIFIICQCYNLKFAK